MPTKEVMRCPYCQLNQWKQATCRRCQKLIPVHEELAEPTPKLEPPPKPARRPPMPSQSLQHSLSATMLGLRTIRGLSQRQLAHRFNSPRSYISKIENGKAMPTLNTLLHFAEAFDMPLSELIGHIEKGMNLDTPTPHPTKSQEG